MIIRFFGAWNDQSRIERAWRLQFALFALPGLANLIFEPLCWPQMNRSISDFFQISAHCRWLSVRNVANGAVAFLLLWFLVQYCVLLLCLRLRPCLAHHKLLTLRLFGWFEQLLSTIIVLIGIVSLQESLRLGHVAGLIFHWGYSVRRIFNSSLLIALACLATRRPSGYPSCWWACLGLRSIQTSLYWSICVQSSWNDCTPSRWRLYFFRIGRWRAGGSTTFTLGLSKSVGQLAWRQLLLRSIRWGFCGSPNWIALESLITRYIAHRIAWLWNVVAPLHWGSWVGWTSLQRLLLVHYDTLRPWSSRISLTGVGRVGGVGPATHFLIVFAVIDSHCGRWVSVNFLQIYLFNC